MRGWFDAFRQDGGPTLYDASNRTAVTGDITTLAICVAFATLYLAFLVIFPGVRKERLTTFSTVTLSLFVGAVILVCSFGSGWHVADKQISSAYRAFSAEKIQADLGVHIGLKHVNVTLKSIRSSNESGRIDYNERFDWRGPDDMLEEYNKALKKGLPYPILTVAEYLSVDEEGFCWGRRYRAAGYFSGLLLWTSFATWLLMNLLIIVVPRYGAYLMVLTGGVMIASNIIYYLMVPQYPLVIRFESVLMTFSLGWCYWLVLAAGILCVVVGSTVSILDLVFPNKFSTTLEVDYDTPYDRHIIIEESHVTKKKPRLEEPPSAGLGRRIIRSFSRLSKRGRGAENEEKFGIDNPALELEPPKSPWRYPHLPVQSHAPHRTQSRKSTKSVNFEKPSMHPDATVSKSFAVSNEVFGCNRLSVPQPTSMVEVCKRQSPNPIFSDDSSLSEEEIERIPDLTLHRNNSTSFQMQFRASGTSIIKRQDSQQSEIRQVSSRLSKQSSQASLRIRGPEKEVEVADPDRIEREKQYGQSWEEPQAQVQTAAHKMASRTTSNSSNRQTVSVSGHSTPHRKISNDPSSDRESADSATESWDVPSQGSGLATLSARLSAAMEADRRGRRSSGDETEEVDMW